MIPNVVDLTKEFVSMPSVSRWSNEAITDRMQALIEAQGGWQIERTHYVDPNGETKVNLVAKLGQGTGGMALCSHNDTVPGQEEDWPAFVPEVKGDNLFGRGSCDMKGPLAATMVAAFAVDRAKLKKPIYIVITSDEELGLQGARFVADNSVLLRESHPEFGVIAEPTSMVPVYSHKGGGGAIVTAIGRAAHSSTGLGVSANLLIAPFLMDMVELDQRLKTDPSFMNDEYNPPHQTLNLTIDDGNCALNVTCPKTVVRVSVRAMPNSRADEVVQIILDKARSYGFEAQGSTMPPLYSPVDCRLIQTSVELTGRQPETVPYGTDGLFLQEHMDELVILGPGSIDVAHTTEEHVPIAELNEAVDVYTRMIERLCM